VVETEGGDRFRIGDELHALLAQPDSEPFPSLVDSLYASLWKRIVNLEFPPGTRLSDEAVARELGVSRTPVREALNRLSQVGLVQVNPRRGFFVPTISREDVIELYDLRQAIEIFVTRRATPVVADEEIAAHREYQRRAHEHAATDPTATAEFYRADLLLHELLHRYGGNRRSARSLADIMGQLALLSLRTAQLPPRRAAAIDEHAAILDALARRDADAAAAAMQAHIEGVKKRVLEDFFEG
jgi:DNA-binding GntR family transcriptional regulator